MPTQEFTLERTSTHTLKNGETLDGFPGGDSYIFTLLSGKAYVQHSDGDLKEITEDGTGVPSSKHGDHKITATLPSAVHVIRKVPDHPNSGVSRTPFPGQVEHPLERQDDPEPKGPPAVLKTKSPGGDPNVVSPAETKQQPQTTVRRLKESGGRAPKVADLPEVESVPSGKSAKKPKARATTRKSKEVKEAAKPSAKTGTGSKSPSASAGSTKRHTGETGRTQTKAEARRSEPKPNVRRVSKAKSPTRTERKR